MHDPGLKEVRRPARVCVCKGASVIPFLLSCCCAEHGHRPVRFYVCNVKRAAPAALAETGGLPSVGSRPLTRRSLRLRAERQGSNTWDSWLHTVHSHTGAVPSAKFLTGITQASHTSSYSNAHSHGQRRERMGRAPRALPALSALRCSEKSPPPIEISGEIRDAAMRRHLHKVALCKRTPAQRLLASTTHRDQALVQRRDAGFRLRSN